MNEHHWSLLYDCLEFCKSLATLMKRGGAVTDAYMTNTQFEAEKVERGIRVWREAVQKAQKGA